MEKVSITQTVSEGMMLAASSFLLDSIEHIIPWLIVTAVVIVTDLITGIRQSLLMGERVRFSRAVRRTMGKMVTYFAFVVMVVLINDASQLGWRIDVYSCLLVCFIEFCSIISNMLKPKGIEFSVVKALAVGLAKLFKVDKKDIEEIVKNKEP